MDGRREIVFDTETTGFDAKGADRITEIGCLEIIDLLPTGRQFHCYLDPQRGVPDKVVEITGLTTEFLRGKPLFKDCLLYTSPSPRDATLSRMPSSA